MTIVTGADLETTGFNAEKGDRIVEICLSMYELETGRHLLTYTRRVNPERSIPAEAQRVHGITLESLRGAPVWKDIAGDVDKILQRTNHIIAHNLEFDAPFLAAELDGVGLSIPSHVNGLCTMAGSRWATSDGKLPRLEELCWALNIPFDRAAAHAADYDVGKMMECFFKGRELGFFPL